MMNIGEFQRNDLPLGLYVILDRKVSGLPHLEAARLALEGGAKVMQLRDKEAKFEELLDVGRNLVSLAEAFGAMLIVNDNPYLAAEIGAHGVHIGQEDIPADIAREVIGPEKILGLSTHNRRQARAAESLPVDYIGVGPVYATKTKQGANPVTSVEFVRWVSGHIRLPHVAIGGIRLEKIPELREAGCQRAAVISDIMEHCDIRARCREYVEEFSRPLK